MRWFWDRSHFSAVAIVAIVAAGCAGGARKPKPIADHRAYLLAEVPEQFDVSAVTGRRIVIDPGHGGPWPGAVGPEGVREADVNLGVALHLWGLLTEAGADVELTRTVDGAVSHLSDPTLKQDLQARADFTMDHAPDIFLSLHHNADIIPGSKKNALETYYQLRGDAPSLDLAQAVHRHLAVNLGERDNAILPGNFHVIREIAVPGVLGEASYISSAENEQHLAFAAMQRLEAEAYFLGIVEYFTRGVPRVVRLSPESGATLSVVAEVSVAFALDRGVPLDPATVDLRLDGERLVATYDADTQTAHALIPAHLPSGAHALTATARNVRGNGTRTARAEFSVDAPPAFASVQTARYTSGTADRAAVVRARILDAYGAPVRRNTAVTFAASAGEIDPPEALTDEDGVAVTVWRGPAEAGKVLVTARCVTVSADGFVDAGSYQEPSYLLQVFSADGDAPLDTAQIRFGDSAVTANRQGIAQIYAEVGTDVHVTAAGYWPATAQVEVPRSREPQRVRLLPVANGALGGEVIAVDAAAGGAMPGAAGPTGVRAADLNLRVAQFLADYLRSAGAVPVLTRTGDETTSAFQRVERSEAAGAARFISIRHGAVGTPERLLDESGYASTADVSRGLVVEHYPTSVAGKRLAHLLRTALVDVLPVRRGRIVQSVSYELTHTASPAVRVQPLTPVDPEPELLLSAPATQRRIAFALLVALAEDFGADTNTLGRISGHITDAAGSPLAGVSVTVGNLWTALTDAEGGFGFALLPPGSARLDIRPVGGQHISHVANVEAGATREITISVPSDASLVGLSTIGLPE